MPTRPHHRWVAVWIPCSLTAVACSGVEGSPSIPADVTTIPTAHSTPSVPADDRTTPAPRGHDGFPSESWIATRAPARRPRSSSSAPTARVPTPLPPTFQAETRPNPDWSPDREHLVFVVKYGATDDLWTVGADGTGADLPVDCRGACRYLDDPACSPDGRSVLYARSSSVAGKLVATLATGPPPHEAQSLRGHGRLESYWRPDRLLRAQGGR